MRGNRRAKRFRHRSARQHTLFAVNHHFQTEHAPSFNLDPETDRHHMTSFRRKTITRGLRSRIERMNQELHDVRFVLHRPEGEKVLMPRTLDDPERLGGSSSIEQLL